MGKKVIGKMVVMVLGSVVLLFFSLAKSFASDSVQSRILLTTAPSSAEQQQVFSANDTIYALVTLSGLDGETQHKATVNWVNPAGSLSQYNVVPFTVRNQSSYTFYSWLRLMKNGPLKSTFTGKNFDDEYLGRWEIHVFLDGAMLERASFTIH